MCYPDRPVKISYWANLTYSLTEAYVNRVNSGANLSHLKSHQPLNPSRLWEKQSFVNDSSDQTIKADRKDSFIKTITVFREVIYLRRPSQHRPTREMRLIVSRSSQSGVYCFLRTSTALDFQVQKRLFQRKRETFMAWRLNSDCSTGLNQSCLLKPDSI